MKFNEFDANVHLTPKSYNPANYRLGFDRNIFLPKRRPSRIETIVHVIVTIACMVLIGLIFAWRG